MRACGILLPIFSLPSPHGIGTFGKAAFDFVDFLNKAGQAYWQILPLNPTTYGDSPYQSFSSFAGNPYFIDLDLLCEEGLITKKELLSFDFGNDKNTVNYGKLYENRLKLLHIAFSHFKPDKKYIEFLRNNGFWLKDYALFHSLKASHGGAAWSTWEKGLRFREAETLKTAQYELREEIDFYCFVQFKFHAQWQDLKDYANKKGVRIIGDIPIYVAYDSADVWSNTNQFLLDEKLAPKVVAGCPPDSFCQDGQLWGNPIYNWAAMKADGYSWWKKYLKHAMSRYDITRIDHFRAFEAYFCIPANDKTAKNGKWIKGPNIDFFNSLKADFGETLPIIAEDLGHLTPEVYELLEKTAFPGMKVLQFAFDGSPENCYLPHNCKKNSVIYIGTHDNDTAIGWLSSATKREVENAYKYLGYNKSDGFNWAMIRTAMSTVADTCILTMADLIGADSSARINTPSTLQNNWVWRIDKDCINDWLASILLEHTRLYGRLPKINKKSKNCDFRL